MAEQRAARIPELSPERMNDDQRRVHEEIVAGPRGTVPAPLAVWLHSPRLAETAQRLGEFARYDTVLPPRLSELAILLTGQFWSADYEWWVHRPIAEEAGVDPALIDAIRDGQEPDFARDDERTVYRFVQQLQRERHVDDGTYDAAIAALGEVGVVDLVGICGYYTLIAMTLNAFAVPLPEGQRSELR